MRCKLKRLVPTTTLLREYNAGNFSLGSNQWQCCGQRRQFVRTILGLQHDQPVISLVLNQFIKHPLLGNAQFISGLTM